MTINTTAVIKKLTKYVIAVLVTMYAWGWAGAAVSAKDNLAVVGGFTLYFLIVAGWIVLIAEEVNCFSLFSLYRKDTTEDTPGKQRRDTPDEKSE
jgi:hypothetical protein